MKKILFAICTVLLSFSTLTAQELHGGFGHGFFGPVFNITPQLQDELRQPWLLGNSFQINSVGMGGGGGGYALLPIKVLVGGSGFGYGVSDATNRGEARVNLGGGLINFGYLVLHKPHLLGFPYVGVGGNGINLTVKNRTENDVFDLDNVLIAPGEEAHLNSGGMIFELGFALKVLAFTLNENNRGGGFMVGFHAGTYLFTGIEDWHNEDTQDLVTSLSKPYAFAPYIGITMGGGGFGREKGRKHKHE